MSQNPTIGLGERLIPVRGRKRLKSLGTGDVQSHLGEQLAAESNQTERGALRRASTFGRRVGAHSSVEIQRGYLRRVARQIVWFSWWNPVGPDKKARIARMNGALTGCTSSVNAIFHIADTSCRADAESLDTGEISGIWGPHDLI